MVAVSGHDALFATFRLLLRSFTFRVALEKPISWLSVLLTGIEFFCLPDDREQAHLSRQMTFSPLNVRRSN